MIVIRFINGSQTMGIKGFFQFFKRWEESITIENAIKQQSVGIDLFCLLYQTKGDDTSLEVLVQPFFQYAREVHIVVDGRSMTQERRETVEERKSFRKGKIEIMEEIRMAPIMESKDQKILDRYLEQLRKQSWKPSRDYIDLIKHRLIEQGAIIHEPDGEADQTLIQLEKSGVIDRIVTNDSDLITLGAESVLRMTPNNTTLLSKTHLRKQMGFTIQQWEDFMYLCRHMIEPDILLAYSLIRVYRELECVLQRWDGLHGEPLIQESYA